MSNSGSDVDLFKVHLQVGDKLTIDTDIFAYYYPDTIIRLFDSSGNQITGNNDGFAPDEYYYYNYPGESYLSYFALAEGDYYIGISDYGNSYYDPNVEDSGYGYSTGDYNLELNVTQIAAESPTNDTIATATETGITGGVATYQSYSGLIGNNLNLSNVGLDVDFYKVQLNQYETITVDTDIFDFYSPDTIIRFFDSSGNELKSNDNEIAPNDYYYYGYFGESYLSFTAVTAGTYYIGISGAYNSSYNPNSEGSGSASYSSGDYNLELQVSLPILGTAGNDTLTGTDTGDIIVALAGNDVISGKNGNDSILAGDGRDTVEGNFGNDTIYGDNGNDLLSGNDGSDIIYGGGDRDTIFGGNGDDSIYGEAGNDLLTGGYGNDSLEGGSGNDTLIGVEPTRTYDYYDSERDVLIGGADRDTFVLGDKDRAYYNDGSPYEENYYGYDFTSAFIKDFNSAEDSIQLHGSRNSYYLEFYSTYSGTTNAKIFYDPGVETEPEYIAELENVSNTLKLQSAAFKFV